VVCFTVFRRYLDNWYKSVASTKNCDVNNDQGVDSIEQALVIEQKHLHLRGSQVRANKLLLLTYVEVN
jgi:hypothetical protein